jgi:hypothetical protein
VFIQLFFVALKNAEVLDGLEENPTRFNERPDEEQYKPLPIYFSDYSYDYTVSASEAESDSSGPVLGR